MKILFYLLGVCSLLNLNAATSASDTTLLDILSFETARAHVRPLMVENLVDARRLDSSDASFVQIISDDFKGHNPEEFSSADIGILKERQNIYYGAFDKDAHALIGLIKVTGFSEDFLRKDTKCHKSCQGKGLMTEFITALYAHYKAKGLIPTTRGDDTLYKGFHCLVHITNKPSLNYNFKCGGKVGLLFGDRVEIYYPFVSEGVRGEVYYPVAGEALHDCVAKSFSQYLSKDAAESAAGEEILRRESLGILMAVEVDSLIKALREESAFFSHTLVRYPRWVDSIAREKLPIVARFLQEGHAELVDAAEDVPAEHKAEFSEFMAGFESVQALVAAAVSERG